MSNSPYNLPRRPVHPASLDAVEEVHRRLPAAFDAGGDGPRDPIDDTYRAASHDDRLRGLYKRDPQRVPPTAANPPRNKEQFVIQTPDDREKSAMTPPSDDASIRADPLEKGGHQEPAAFSVTGRRVFHRLGPVRQSGGERLMVKAPTRDSLSLAKVFGGGRNAAQVEVAYGHEAIPPGADPWMLYALVNLHASSAVMFPRTPLNLTLVLDHSSSMLRGGRADGLRGMVRAVIDQLDDDDFLSIVTFGERAEVLLPAQPLRDRRAAYSAMETLRCRGGTELSRGLAAGLAESSRYASRALSHLIVVTDGETDDDQEICIEYAREAAVLAVGVTTYGLGEVWEGPLLDRMAAVTGGRVDLIEDPEAMAATVVARVAALQATTIHPAMLSLSTVDGCTLQRATLVAPGLRPLPVEWTQGATTRTWALDVFSSNEEHLLLLEFMLEHRAVEGLLDIGTLTLRYDVRSLQRAGETVPAALGVKIQSGASVDGVADPHVLAALHRVMAYVLQERAWPLAERGEERRAAWQLRKAAAQFNETGRGALAAYTATAADRLANGERIDEATIKHIVYGARQ